MFVLVFAAQKKPGDDGFLAPAKKNGKLVVMMPEALVGVLLEMVSGSELTPKGGLEKMLAAHEKEEELPKPTGKFGSGAYKDERWSLTALRKRVTSVRKFYDLHVEGDKKLVNPGYANMVDATMSSIVLLLGTTPIDLYALRAREARGLAEILPGPGAQRSARGGSSRAQRWGHGQSCRLCRRCFGGSQDTNSLACGVDRARAGCWPAPRSALVGGCFDCQACEVRARKRAARAAPARR